jgi:hypothetical protein
MKESNEAKLEWLRREIQKGIDSLEAGNYSDGPEAMRRIKERLLKLKDAKNLKPDSEKEQS